MQIILEWTYDLFFIPKVSRNHPLLGLVNLNEWSGLTGKLDNLSWLQTGHKLLVPSISCRYNLLRQVTFQRHWSQIRNIISLSFRFLA